MVHRDAERIDRVVRESLRQTDNRGIILSGWSGIRNQSSRDVLYLEATPHDWLFPHCRMVVHHGGAGTTSAGLRGGIPNVVVPFTADQPFWGKRVQAIGAGPKPILVKKLTVENLRRAIAEAEGEVLHERAHAIGQAIRSEDGVSSALNLIEKFSNDYHND
jgi:sterol 3beta-glucosyltransferase